MSKNTKKILLTTFCALVLVAGSVLGTLAYLSDQTSTVTNTFTVGKVDIDLYEHKVEKNATTGAFTLDSATKVVENTYEKVLPGMTMPKDPTIEVLTGSENCYVGAVVTLSVKDIEKTPLWSSQYGFVDLTGFVTGGISGGTWTPNGLVFTNSEVGTITQSAVTTADGKDTVTFTYVFKDVKKVGDKITLFEVLHTDGEKAALWTNEAIAAIDGMEIKVDAYAVQAESFADAATALHAGFADKF